MTKTGILVPALLRDQTPLRKANFFYVLQTIIDAGFAENLVVALQVTPTSLDVTEEIGLMGEGIEVLTFEIADEEIHKSFLVNRATDVLAARGHSFALMIDADIHLNVRGVIDQMEELDPNLTGAVKPFRFFFRLNREKSEKVRQKEKVTAKISDYPDKERVDYPAAGAWGYSIRAYREVHGMEENYVGWGWEDTEFSLRLRSQFVWTTLNGVGYHLDHENDRQVSEENFNLFLTKTDSDRPDWSQMATYVKPKLVVLSTARTGSSLLARSLGEHPDIDMFVCRDKSRKAVHGTTELFEPNHFGDDFPEEWTGPEIVKYIGRRLSDSSANYQGFKLILGQPSEKDFKRLIKYMGAQPHNYRTILVSRRNKFEQAVSFLLSLQSEKWVGPHGDGKYHLEFDHLVERVRRIEEGEALIKKHLPEIIQIDYEALVEQWDVQIKDLLGQLGLTQVPLRKVMKKRTKPFSHWVSNFGELEKDWETLS